MDAIILNAVPTGPSDIQISAPTLPRGGIQLRADQISAPRPVLDEVAKPRTMGLDLRADTLEATVVLKAETTAGEITKLALVQLDSSVAGGSAITLSADVIRVAGTMQSGDSLDSDDFVAGTSGWQIQGDGDAEFNDVIVRGGGGVVTIDPTDGIDIDGSSSYLNKNAYTVGGGKGRYWYATTDNKVHLSASGLNSKLQLSADGIIEMGSDGLDISVGMGDVTINNADVLVDNSVSGSFTTTDGKTVTVSGGQITDIS